MIENWHGRTVSQIGTQLSVPRSGPTSVWRVAGEWDRDLKFLDFLKKNFLNLDLKFGFLVSNSKFQDKESSKYLVFLILKKKNF